MPPYIPPNILNKYFRREEGKDGEKVADAERVVQLSGDWRDQSDRTCAERERFSCVERQQTVG